MLAPTFSYQGKSRLALATGLLLVATLSLADTITLSTNDYPPYNTPALPHNGIIGAISEACISACRRSNGDSIPPMGEGAQGKPTRAH